LLNKSDYNCRFGNIDFLDSANQSRYLSSLTRKTRHKIEQARYKVTNWRDYNNALPKRGEFTVYFTDAAIAHWHPAKTGSRGRPQK
jgi:hypothetical protein